MGRFFQASDSKYVDDFIYTPPWELIAGITQKQDQNVQTSLDTMEVMRNLPINYWKGVDDERAKAVQDEWAQKVQDVTQKVSKDYLNPANRAEIMNLKSQLNKDVTSGNISKLQANATAYNDLVAKASLIKDDATRAKYLEDLPKKYLKDNPEGAYSSIFKPGELQQHRNIPGEFIDYFRDKKPQVFSSVMDKVNGRWVVKDSSEKTQSLVGNLFQEFIGANTDIKGYMQHRQNSGIFDETYFNEDGTYNTDPNSTFSNMNNFVQNESYTQERKGRELSENQVQAAADQRAFQDSQRRKNEAYQDKVRREERVYETMKAAREGKDTDFDILVGTDKKTDSYFNTTDGKRDLKEYFKTINQYIQRPGTFKSQEDKEYALKHPNTWAKKVASDPNNPLFKEISSVVNLMNANAGTNKLALMGFSPKDVKIINDNINSKSTNGRVKNNSGYISDTTTKTPIFKNQMQLPKLIGTKMNINNKLSQVTKIEVIDGQNFIGGPNHLSSTIRIYSGDYNYQDYDFDQTNLKDIITIIK